MAGIRKIRRKCECEQGARIQFCGDCRTYVCEVCNAKKKENVIRKILSKQTVKCDTESVATACEESFNKFVKRCSFKGCVVKRFFCNACLFRLNCSFCVDCHHDRLGSSRPVEHYCRTCVSDKKRLKRQLLAKNQRHEIDGHFAHLFSVDEKERRFHYLCDQHMRHPCSDKSRNRSSSCVVVPSRPKELSLSYKYKMW